VKRVRKPNPALGLDEDGADSEEMLEDFRTEVDLMKSLDHPSICRLLEVFEDAKNLYLVMEHIRGGELFDRISDGGSFSEIAAARVLHQAASALSYCHARGVVHRDIKPENIMVVDEEEDGGAAEPMPEVGPTVKLIDFGFGCRILQGVKLKAKVGTFVYSAPEVFKGDPPDEKLDLWALGCVLYVLLSGDAPFFGRDARNSIVQGSFSMEGEVWASISEEAKALIRRLLTVSPADRPSAAEALQDPWLALLSAPPESRALRTSLTRQMQSLKAFHKRGVFRHLCSGVLARQMDESVLHQLHCSFELLDKDGDGMISVEEFKRECQELGLSKGAGEDLDAIFRDVDMDQSGHIDYTEFIAACIDRKIEEHESVCWSAFEVFDLNRDGVISYDELCQMMDSATLKAHFPPEAMQRVWRRLRDVCGAECDVDFDHFLLAMRGARAGHRSGEAFPEEPSAKDEGQRQPPPAAASGLPIAKRQQGAVAAMGLPIAHRGASGLPIASRSGGGATGLPIASRQPASGGMGLPIASRR